MSHRITDGLATYGIIRLFNSGKTFWAMFILLLFTVGPVGLLLAAILGWHILKMIIIPMLIACAIVLPAVVAGDYAQSKAVTVGTGITLAIIIIPIFIACIK